MPDPSLTPLLDHLGTRFSKTVNPGSPCYLSPREFKQAAKEVRLLTGTEGTIASFDLVGVTVRSWDPLRKNGTGWLPDRGIPLDGLIDITHEATIT